MRTLRRTLLGFALGALVVVAAPAQTPKKNANDNAVPKYNVAQEVKVKGEVLEIKEYECPVSGGFGAHIVLQTSEGPLEIHLALASFLKEYGINFAKGDKLEIVGNKITFHDAPSMLVRKIIKDQSEYVFRDPQGKPLWVPRTAPRSERK
jgi:DNA/RNA endonuclease YhcR with UshA esterase domain